MAWSEKAIDDALGAFYNVKRFGSPESYRRAMRYALHAASAVDGNVPHARLVRASEVIVALLQCAEIADCDPRDKDEQTQTVEREARKLLAEFSVLAAAAAVDGDAQWNAAIYEDLETLQHVVDNWPSYKPSRTKARDALKRVKDHFCPLKKGPTP